MRAAWSARALLAVARALLPRRVFVALVAPVVTMAGDGGFLGAVRMLAAVVEQLGRYALLVVRDWILEADLRARGWLAAAVTPGPIAPAMEVSMSLGDRMLSRADPAARRRAIAGTAAIAVHAAVIVVAVVWSAVKVDELPAPPLGTAIVFREPPKPPPAPERARATERRKPRRVSQAGPTEVPQARAAEAKELAPVQQRGEVAAACTVACGSARDGDGEGDGDGDGDGDGPAMGTAPEPRRFIPPTWRQPERTGGGDPAYTPAARAARLEGSVKLKICFDRQGAVTDATVLQGMPMGMTEAAERAVRAWRYRPYLVGGQPIRGCVLTTFNFRLRD